MTEALSIIKQHPKKEQLYQELKNQLAKDLGLTVQEIKDKHENLLEWLTEYLEKEMLARPELNQRLYQIDLPQNAPYHNSEQLALAILSREAHKVLFRAQYSGKL
jgi:hypothetical protein